MEIVETPHFRYPDWPGETILYTEGDNGSATLKNNHDGSILFFRSSGAEFEHTACYTYADALVLLDQLTRKIKEMADFREKYNSGDYDDEDGRKYHSIHQWLGKCPACGECHTDIGEVVELNRQVTAQ